MSSIPRRKKHRKPYNLGPSFVYLLRGGDSDCYKIGYSRDVDARIKVIMEWPDFRLLPDDICLEPITEVCKVLLPTRSMAYQFEHALHWRYGAQSVGGEWFEFDSHYVDDARDVFAVARWFMLAGRTSAGQLLSIPQTLNPRNNLVSVWRRGFWKPIPFPQEANR